MVTDQKTQQKKNKKGGSKNTTKAAPSSQQQQQPPPKEEAVVEDLTLLPDKAACDALCEALYKCTGPFKRMISPLLPYSLVLNKLHKDLVEAQEMSGGSADECQLTFAMKMEDPATKTFLEDAQARIRAEPGVYGQNKLEEDWVSDFQAQVDYVPGLSKGKRLLDVEATEQFVALGQEMKTAGNTCFAAKDYDMALTRYTQGVELLNNVECKDASGQQDLTALLGALLTNQAIAALRTGAWRTAIAACNACLGLNPENLKARARRAEANKCLGELEAASADLNWILRLQADDLLRDHDKETALQLLGTAQKEAKRMLKDIGSLRIQESETAKRMIAGADFTANRDQETTIIKHPTAAVPSSSSSSSASSSFSIPSTSSLMAAAKRSMKVTEKLIDEVVALEIQRTMVDIYARPEVQAELYEMRKASDYESSRFVQRLRPFLVCLLQEPVLSKYQFGEGEGAYRQLERALGQHVTTSEDVKDNAKRILSTLMGDLLDD